jgi:alkylation response protein AidB-like acyl-CoA dehydrogenase
LPAKPGSLRDRQRAQVRAEFQPQLELAVGADEAQRERWLWPNLRGDLRSALALTEPSGSSAAPTMFDVRR